MNPKFQAAGVALGLLCWLVDAAASAEIPGKVTSVDDRVITIRSESNLLPEVGDKVTVLVEIPGVGKATLGSGVVSQVADDTIVAKIDKATGRLAKGQLVAIDSPNPKSRSAPKVPILIGRTAADAKQAVEAAGFVAKIQVGINAPAGVKPFTVFSQEPSFGSELAAGATVVITLFGEHGPDATPSPSRQASSNTGSVATRKVIPGWGEVIDPAGDCTIVEQGGTVSITVPTTWTSGSKVPDNPHDLNPNPDKGLNAPRILQEVTGDFTVEVRVRGFRSSGYAGGGLVVWQDGGNFLRFLRLSLGVDAEAFMNSKQAGRRMARTYRGDIWLAIVRKQGRIAQFFRKDKDMDWTFVALDRAEGELKLDDRVRVGVALVANFTKQPVTVAFDSLTITNKATLPVPPFEPALPSDSDKQDMVERYHRLANHGDADAAYKLAELYREGKEVPKDMKRAIEFYSIAAKTAHPQAQTAIGEAALSGDGVQKDYATALAWFKLAGENGDYQAWFNLGLMYEFGNGVDQDFNKAREYYTRWGDEGPLGADQHLKRLDQKQGR